ncbi:hypothetical protein J5X84_40635 [Streptosporangiaceae bacterium NEAU-GS5]|nr:hypothetical protein [Streptosporangiaceae bacterium NEAU-GS5]
MLVEPEGTAVAVITAAATWLSTRRRMVKIRVKQGDREIEVEAGSTREIAKTVRHVMEVISSGRDRPD